jgi:hypothetical protein
MADEKNMLNVEMIEDACPRNLLKELACFVQEDSSVPPKGISFVASRESL